MLTGYDNTQINEWKSSLYEYEKQKRTKKPFGKDSSVYDKKIVHSSDMKQKQRQFDPILQRYSINSLQKTAQQRQQQRKNISLANYLKNNKQQMNYDIVNLHPFNQADVNPQLSHDQWSRHKNKNNPIRNLYNIISNQSTPSSYIKNRNIKVDDRQQKRKVFNEKLKLPDFDIVKARYMENDEQKTFKETEKEVEKIKTKLNKSHQFDSIYQRYYDPERQESYNSQLQKSQLIHGKDHDKRLPPSYNNRQPYMPSFSEQASPPGLKKIIERQQNALKRHQLRYAVEDEFKKRNDQDYQRKQEILKNKVHEGKILENMVKEYDIINNKLHQVNPSNHFQKKINQHPYSYDFLKKQNLNRSTYDQMNQLNQRMNPNHNWDTQSQAYSTRSKSSADRSDYRRFSIKSGGFC